ncbi:MAG: hypothetical protein EOO62_25270 [Hymenobacter sp.]|nr:MAG: hypothetical protein EOO62_25270 [Hymenobacter sp.]
MKEDGSVEASSRTDRTLAQGGGIKYQGTWTSASTGRTVQALWVENIIGYHGPHAFADFLMGDRGMEINPKYAKLGWDNYWANDEWWAASPKPRLSL